MGNLPTTKSKVGFSGGGEITGYYFIYIYV